MKECNGERPSRPHLLWSETPYWKSDPVKMSPVNFHSIIHPFIAVEKVPHESKVGTIRRVSISLAKGNSPALGF